MSCGWGNKFGLRGNMKNNTIDNGIVISNKDGTLFLLKLSYNNKYLSKSKLK